MNNSEVKRPTRTFTFRLCYIFTLFRVMCLKKIWQKEQHIHSLLFEAWPLTCYYIACCTEESFRWCACGRNTQVSGSQPAQPGKVNLVLFPPGQGILFSINCWCSSSCLALFPPIPFMQLLPSLSLFFLLWLGCCLDRCNSFWSKDLRMKSSWVDGSSYFFSWRYSVFDCPC